MKTCLACWACGPALFPRSKVDLVEIMFSHGSSDDVFSSYYQNHTFAYIAAPPLIKHFCSLETVRINDPSAGCSNSKQSPSLQFANGSVKNREVQSRCLRPSRGTCRAQSSLPLFGDARQKGFHGGPWRQRLGFVWSICFLKQEQEPAEPLGEERNQAAGIRWGLYVFSLVLRPSRHHPALQL